MASVGAENGKTARKTGRTTAVNQFASMKLYDAGRAPNPRRVKIFLAEKGVEIERQQIDINQLEQYSGSFSKINPMQRLPVLVLADGTAISESVAICRYIEALEPEPPLFGIDDLDRAIVEMWQRRIEFGLMMPVAFSFRHLHPGAAHLEKPQVPQWGEACKPRARQFMEFLDGELAGREFIAGDRFTIADISGIVSLQFLKPARIDQPEDLVNLVRWRDAVAARPSVAGN
jgi:glutathione S-transferase